MNRSPRPAFEDLWIAGNEQAPSFARMFARDCCRRWSISANDVDTVQLCFSELVTNAIEHTRTPLIRVKLVLFRRDAKLFLSVRDGGTARPTTREVKADDERGRGLLIVDLVSDSWGVRVHSRGKLVWCWLAIEAPAEINGLPVRVPMPRRHSLDRVATASNAVLLRRVLLGLKRL
jgi:anti-sigma regulatory factor (Ser/Thr protein kinase)